MSACATRKPSVAALMIPPAYPAPSPQGMSPCVERDSSVSLRVSLSGELERVSTPVKTASSQLNPCNFLSSSGSASRRVCVI